MDGFEDILLEDVGVGSGQRPPQRGEIVESLPARRQQAGLVNQYDTGLTGISPPYTTRRFSRQEQMIIERIRESALTQEGIAGLVERAQALSGEQRLNTAMRLKSEAQTYFLIRDIAMAENRELGEVVDQTVKRLMHDRNNNALGLHNMADEIIIKEIIRAQEDIKDTPRRRTFWDSVFGGQDA